MGLIEIIAVILFAVSMLGAFFQFFPQWKPESPAFVTKAWETFTNTYVSLGLFLLGMALLFLFG